MSHYFYTRINSNVLNYLKLAEIFEFVCILLKYFVDK